MHSISLTIVELRLAGATYLTLFQKVIDTNLYQFHARYLTIVARLVAKQNNKCFGNQATLLKWKLVPCRLFENAQKQMEIQKIKAYKSK